MVALKIADRKSFMSKLLIHHVFDDFLLFELELNTYNQFHISGKLNETWFSKEEYESLRDRKYSKWEEIKPIVYQLIKGNESPLSFQIVFLLPPEKLEEFLMPMGNHFHKEDIGNICFNLKYNKGELYLVTSITLSIFTEDRTIELEWDAYIKEFLMKNGIYWEF